MNRHYASVVPEGLIPPKGTARILLLDIETAPVLGYVWGLFDQNVGLNQIAKDWFILSFAAKWLGESKMIYFDQSKAADVEDDTDMLAKIHELLDKADIVVAHNAKRFDVKKMNARFILAGLPPTSPYRIVDTLLIAKSKFMFTSNRLEYLADKLNVTYKKLKHGNFAGFELWKAVLKGERAAWKEMRTYNEHDVLALEELYMTLRPWDDKHPNVNIQDEAVHACPICGGTHLEKRGFQFSNTGKFQRYRCECGAWSRGIENLYAKVKRKVRLTK